MIPNQWYVILESNEVKRSQPIGFTRFGEKLMAWRDSHGKISIMRDRCPHRGVALRVGEIRGDCIECPFHGFQFDTTGKCTVIPANGKSAEPPKAMHATAYPAQEAHGFVYVWYGEPQPEYPPLPFFEVIDDSFSYMTITDLWKCHYSRAIENQLDVVHLPFVHRNTIGRGNQTLVNGPRSILTRGDNDRIELWYDNAVDHGQPPLKPSEMPETDRHPLIQFYFPNLWHNWLGDKLHLLIAFVPIDDATTLMYIRAYQKIMTAPGLRTVFNWINAMGNFVIERQDRRVVITQEPKRADLNIGETLIAGDAPIVQYRRRRRELIEKADVSA
jgi:phenylpropionate dioxygenase-like ring-hydroxylating dioxygenase large terminal subunit